MDYVGEKIVADDAEDEEKKQDEAANIDDTRHNYHE